MLTTSISKIHTRFWVLQLTRQLHSVRVRIVRNIRINNFWTLDLCRGGFQRRNNDNRQIEMKFHPYGASGSSRSTLATFAQVKEALMLKIEKDYEWGKDIADSLQQMSYIDMNKSYRSKLNLTKPMLS